MKELQELVDRVRSELKRPAYSKKTKVMKIERTATVKGDTNI